MRSIIINTPEKCVGCNRCVRVCPISEANITREDADGKRTVEIDHNKCIACGACLVACHHGSRHYEDDTEQFFSDLRSGVPISMFAAPASKTNFEEWGRMIAWFRSIGVQKIYDVSLGADICTWAHIRYIQKNGPHPIISQPCPAIVNYILMHRNELLKYLSPVHSPMLCTAVYMRRYENVNTKIAAISPCVAKAHEFEATRLVDYNVTINNLYKYIEENGVVFPRETSGFDSYKAGLGSLYPMPGGLKECVEHYVGKGLRVDKAEGQHTIYKALDEYSRQPESKLPVLFDVLNCAEGCNMGTGCRHDGIDIFDINTSMDDLRQESLNVDGTEYLDELFARFDEELHLGDFIRRYTPIPSRPIPITQDKINEAFIALGKLDDASMNFNCSACGCDTCLEMAQKIAKGINTPASCAEKAHTDILKQHSESIVFQTTNLDNYETILDDTAQIRNSTEGIMANMVDITEAISAYNQMVRDIEKIALQVNIISLNASIEAARAGQHGKAFGVVAEEIRSLSQSSNDAAQQTKAASVKANAAIEAVNSMMKEIHSSVQTSYENISNISENTKRILNGDD